MSRSRRSRIFWYIGLAEMGCGMTKPVISALTQRTQPAIMGFHPISVGDSTAALRSSDTSPIQTFTNGKRRLTMTDFHAPSKRYLLVSDFRSEELRERKSVG